MFKLESYITPLLMGYVDKYVKLKPEDFQLSLWGGDAVLNNLDLRLDVIEKAIQLPIVFKSGHIHEIRLHVPWTKLGSEPIVVTINTIECILKLRDTAYDGDNSSRSAAEKAKSKSPQVRARTRRQDAGDIPPGYLQSLMNKITNNLSIIVNNLIIKFVEDDIVLSINMKSAEVYSVDELWNRAFIDLSPPEFLLRKSINFCDLTVCLDKCNSSGKIENYQDPLIYRCSVTGRLYLKYDGAHSKFPTITKFDVFCDKLDISLTDTQLPLFFRLVELCVALYYGTLEFPSAPESDSSEPSQQELARVSEKGADPENPEPTSPKEDDVGWAQWAWSYVPQILPSEEEELLQETKPKKKHEPLILSVGMYAHKITLVFKLTEKIREKVHYGPQKVAFRPFMLLEGEGIALEILVQGLLFFDVQFGVTNMLLTSQGQCICGAEDKDDQKSNNILIGGDNLQTKVSSNYYTHSLFDVNCPANQKEPLQFVLDGKTHRQINTEQHGMQRFGVFWLDYLYVLEQTQKEGHGSVSSMSDQEDEVFLHENSLTRYIVGPCKLNVSSSMVHRIQKFLKCAANHNYLPYSSEKQEVVDENRKQPTIEQIASMEEYLPTRTQHLTILQPTGVIFFAEHAQCDVGKKSYRTSQTNKKKQDQDEKPLVSSLPCIHISAARFDLQVTKPMYPRKLVRMISMIAGPSSNLLHHCHTHTQVKVFGLEAGLVRIDQSGNKSHVVTVIPPCSGALYTRHLLLSMYWKNTQLPKLEQMYELPQISINITKANLLLGLRIWSSWQQNVPKLSTLSEDSLEDDIFCTNEQEGPKSPLIEVTVSGFEMKKCRSTLVTAYTGTISSVQAILYDGIKSPGKPLVCGPVDTGQIYSPEFFQKLSELGEVNNDCLTCTLQIPNQADITSVPSVLLLNMEGIVASDDPGLLDWFSYTPSQNVIPSDAGGEKSSVKVDIEIAKAAVPLQRNISQVSVISDGSLSRSHTETLTKTRSVSRTIMEGNKETTQEAKVVSVWGKKLATLFPYIRMLQLQVDVKRSVAFLSPSRLPLIEPDMCIPRNYLTALSQGLDTEAIVICLPQICVHSSGLKPVSAIQEIPIQSLEGSLVGEKLPWAINLEHFSIYTILSREKIYPIIKPTSVNCTLAVTSVYNPPTSDKIASLGLCLHTDMHAVKISCSKPQVHLVFKCTNQLLTLMNNCIDLGKAALKHLKVSNPTKNEQVTPASPSVKQTLPTDIDREPYLTDTETSGDLTSRETTPSLDVELGEDTSDRVDLSLWLQWTLPKFEISFYKLSDSRKQDTKVCLLVEDVTLSLDVERVYAKAKVTCASCNVHHYSKEKCENSAWGDGEFLGILMTCRKELSHDVHISAKKLWSSEGSSLGNHFSIGEATTRDVTHGFMTFTFTRALCKNVKKKMRKLNSDLYGASEEDSAHDLYFHKYISELCLSIEPCDFVFYTPAVETIIDSFEGWGYQKKSSVLPTTKISKRKMESPEPIFTSGGLPLLYVNLSSVRIFFPSKDLKTASKMAAENTPNSSNISVKTTLDHDLVVGLLHSVSLVPQADNPLPRYAIDKDLYHKSLQFGLTQQPGSSVEDRQYQIEIKGLAVCSGCWDDFLQRSDNEKKKEKSMLPVQIPALEWNTVLKPFDKPKEDIMLLPLVSSMDMRIVAAPAIVYNSPQTEIPHKVLVCGYSLEVNVTSDLDLFISSNQVHLLHGLINRSMSRLYPTKSNKAADRCKVSEENKEKAFDHQTIDSGIDSDASTVTHIMGNKSHATSAFTSSDQGQSSKVMTPFDILLTASRISCTLYGNKILEKDVEIDTKISESRKIRKSDLEWKGLGQRNPSGSSSDTPNDAVKEEEQIGFSFLNIHEITEPEKKTLHQGSACSLPFLYLYISQPHTVLSCLDSEQKFEMSCYDILVKGPSAKYIAIDNTKVMPDCADFGVYWIETRAGKPHPKTGIPPSLYTLQVTDFIQDPANIKLKIERPLKLNLSLDKFDHLENFINELIPTVQEKPTRSKDTGTGSKGSNSDTIQAILSKIYRLELSTEQLVVSLETTSSFKDSGLLGHVHGMMIDIGLIHNSRRVESVSANLLLKDLLVQTVYKKKIKPLIGPFEFNVDAVIQWFETVDKQLLVPKATVSMSTGLITVSLGQEHFKCFNALKKQFLEKQTKKTDVKKTKAEFKRDEKPKHFYDHVAEHTRDDLRTGKFQYIMDPDETTVFASPGEIIFCNQDADGNSSMSWCYNEPRIISTVTFTPIPFNLPGDGSGDKNEAVMVPCQLQYFDFPTRQFVTYVEFELSENKGTDLSLPEVKEINVKDLLVSQIWRVLIRYDLNPEERDTEVTILPASLAASMRVDSCYIPNLVPVLQIYVSSPVIELRLSNHLQCLNKDVPSKLKPFVFQKSSSEDEEFALVTFKNPILIGSHLVGSYSRTSTQITTGMEASVVEYRNLTLQPAIDMFDLYSDISYSPLKKSSLLENNITVDPVTIRVGKGVVHTLNCAALAWNQVYNDKNKECCKVVMSHYVICNDTCHPVRFGQVGTDENLVLKPREMCCYSWRTHKNTQKLHLCLDGKIWKWCDGFSIDNDSHVVRAVRTIDQKYTLIIQVKPLSNVQKQVIIKGQLLVSNRLLQNLEMKISTLAATSPDAIEIDGLIQSEQTLPTYVLEPEEIKCIKIRMQGQTAWTQEILVSGDRMESSRQIKIMLHHNTFIHIWCKILTQKIQSALLTVVIFSPLYVIRSHLPKSLFVSVETPKIKQNYQVQIPGQGREFHLDCLGSNAAQSLAFHLSSEKEKSRPSLTLSTGMIDQVERANIKNMDIDSLTTQWKSSVLKEWPYCYNEGEFSHPGEPLSTPEYSEFDLSLQTIDLHVNLSEYWPGCDTLLVDVFPWCLMTNRCDLDLVVILANGDTWTLPSKKTISPPTFDDGFNIGLLSDGNLYKTRDLKLSGEDVSTHKYMADIDTTLYMDGCLHTQIVTTTKSGKQIYFISLQSSFKHKIRIISVHETFCLTNLTNHTLKAALHCVSQKGKKVEPAYHCALNIPSHVKCKKDDSDIYPLTKWCLLEEMESANPQHSNKSDDYVQYLLLMDNTPANHKSCNSSSESTENVDSLVSDWSYPLRLLSNENKARMTLSLPRPGETPYPLCITSHIKNGVCYFVIEEDKSPICRLCNKTSIPVHYGYYDNIVAMSGVTVQEETELIDLLPTIKPGGIVFYTPGLINRKFHEGIFRKVPKLHIGIYPSDIGKIDSSQACLWSNAIDVNSNFESFVPIKNAVDVKVKVEKVAMVINVTIQPISKVDVSAKEIRSRISGKDTKVISESEQESFKVCLEMEKEETENAKITFDETRLLYSIGLHIHHICVILQDESDSQTISEVLRVSVDNLFLAHHPSSQGFTENSLSEKYHICTSVCAASIQIDNQLFYAKGLFDFPVIFIKQSNAAKTMFAVPEFHSLSVIEKLAVMKSTSFAHMQIIMEEDILGNPVIGTLELAIEPSVVNIDDNFVFRILKEIEGLIPTNLSDSKHSRIDIKKLPKSFRKMSGVLSCPIRIKHLCIQPISVLLSVHASMKLFIASDRTPLSFGSFDKEGVTSTTHQLIQVLVMHYASGALFRAGIVVGSLEILGNPTGLVRSIGTGVADLVKLPYAGLTRGPGAFVKGVSGGMSSCIKNISSGMITSVTNFASSVSRNMDRLSMDSTHLQRQEVQRRQMPDGISSGLKQGLTSFGISLLGAVAGLADQPIQNILSQEGDSDNQLSKSKTASGIVTGVGKGLVGVFTKPIGGAAELVSQTGQGLLHGTGLASNRQNPIYKPEKILISESSNGRIKYIKKFLHSVPNSDIQMMVKADFIDLTESDVKVDLLLTNELLFVINCEDDAQQQAFSLAELEMSSNDSNPRLLTLHWRDTFQQTSTECNENKDRVAEFIDGTLVYVSQVTPSPSTTCDSQSESSLSPVGRPSAGPQFHFLLDKSYKESFISLFYMIKDTLSGKGFII